MEKNFCLRGGQEHRNLKLSQFVREKDHWKHIETGSKNFRGGVADLRRENKVFCQYPCSQLGNRCHFRLLDLYMEKLPAEAKEKNGFYLSPLQKFTKESKPWFSLTPLGKNTLDRFVKDFSTEAGIEGKTNHSLRATGTTRMYRKGIPEKAIQSRTGHKSIEALRTYERVSTDQERSMCRVLSDVTNQHPGMLLDPAVSQITKPLNRTVDMSVSQLPFGQMTPAKPVNPTFNMSSCTVNIYNAPVSFQASTSQLSENYKLSQTELDDFVDF